MQNSMSEWLGSRRSFCASSTNLASAKAIESLRGGRCFISTLSHFHDLRVRNSHAADFADRLHDLCLGEGPDQELLEGVLNAGHLRGGRSAVIDDVEPIVGAQVTSAGPLVV